MKGDDDGKREPEMGNRRESWEKTRRSLSLISLAIARTASYPAGVSSMDAKELIPGLYKGVILDDQKVKFWIDEKLHKNCFMLLPNGFDINRGDEEYWSWIPYKEDCFGGPVEIQIARLNYIWWLGVSRKLPSIMLSPMTTYEVVFVLKMTEDASGWDLPINFTLSLPDGTTHNRMENLGEKPKGEWFEILLGEFVASPENVGYIYVNLPEYNTQCKKEGLMVKGVTFRPKY